MRAGNDEGGEHGERRIQDGRRRPDAPPERDPAPTETRDCLDSIVPHALGLPESDRDPYLVQACQGDKALLADARAFLADSVEAERYMEDLAARAGVLLDQALDASHPRIGTRIGPYRIERLLGAGGMGDVFLARRDDGQFEMSAAVKVLRPGQASSALHDRFLEERRILASLEHPGIARLLDGGLTEDGHPCFVMELAEGEAIDTHCDRVNAGLERRLDLFLEVCDAVAHAHGKGVVHRDLKPGNIVVTREGRVKLLDFGIARSLEEADPRTQSVDPLLSPLTLAWASPEQLRGGAVGTASDVYQLGLLLQTLVGARDQEGLGESLDRVVRRAIERDPTLRHPDAGLLAHDIRQFLRTRAATASTGPGGAPRARRMRGAVAALILLAATSAFFLLPLGRSPEAPAPLPADAPISGALPLAILPFEMQGEGSEGQQDPTPVVVITDFLQGLGLVELVPTPRIPGRISGVEEATEPALSSLAAVGAGAVLTGTVTRVGTRITARASIVSLADADLATDPEPGEGASPLVIATFEREGPTEAYDRILEGIAVEVLQAFVPEIPARAAEQDAGTGPQARDALRRFFRGEAEFRAARYFEARGHFQAASDLVPDFALAHYRNAVTHEWAGLGAQPLSAERAWDLRERLPEQERSLVEAYHLYRSHLDAAAEAHYRVILRRFPGSVEAWYNLGEVLFHRGPQQGRSILDAKGVYERVLDLDPRHLQSLVHLARLAALEGDTGALDDYVSRYLAHVSAEESRGIELRLLGAVLRDDVEEIDTLSRLLDRDTDMRRWLTAGRVAIYTGKAQAALDLLQPLFLPHQQAEVRGSAHLLALHVEMMRGSMEGADAHAEQLAAISTGGAAVARAWIALHPARTPDPARLAAAQPHLLRWWDEVDRYPGILGLHPRTEQNRSMAADLLARVALALGDDQGAQQWRRELATHGTPMADRLGVILEARVRFASGDVEGALAVLDGLERSGDAYATGDPMFQPLVEARLLQAQLLESLGRTEEARTLWDSFAEDYVFAIGYMRLGRG